MLAIELGSIMTKRVNTFRQAKTTYRQRTKASVKNVPASKRPERPEMVFVYADEDLGPLDVKPSNDNVTWAGRPRNEL